MAKWQRIKIPIKKKFKPEQRRFIAQEIIDYMIKRSKEGRDKNERPFPKYSKSYINSKDFKIAGKSKNRVNLTLSDEMLNSIELLSHKSGELTIGFDKGDSELNGKAEGNILGTYGSKTPKKNKQRDFLGIKDKKKEEIENKYDDNKVDRSTILERMARLREFLGNNTNNKTSFSEED